MDREKSWTFSPVVTKLLLHRAHVDNALRTDAQHWPRSAWLNGSVGQWRDSTSARYMCSGVQQDVVTHGGSRLNESDGPASTSIAVDAGTHYDLVALVTQLLYR